MTEYYLVVNSSRKLGLSSSFSFLVFLKSEVRAGQFFIYHGGYGIKIKYRLILSTLFMFKMIYLCKRIVYFLLNLNARH